MTLPIAAPRPPRTRVSPLRVVVVAACIAAVGWTGTQAVAGVVNRPVTPGPSVFAAYVDVTATPLYAFETPSGPAESNVILSFVVADPDESCAPSWGGAYSLAEAASDLELERRLSQLRSTGGNARVSFGGQRGPELAVACDNTSALARAYQSVVDRYDLTSIDLDLEGASLDDDAASARRATAIARVQDRAAAADRPLAVWLTLPVAPTGLTSAGVAVVTRMLAAGVDVAGVNGMTMDFGITTSVAAPQSDVVTQAATALHGQVRAAYSAAGVSMSAGQAWGRVGITTMIGQNDVPTETFTFADAVVVNAFVREHGLGQLAIWSLNRDSTCASPLPSVLVVVQTSCSGVDQGELRFAKILAADATFPLPTPAPSPSGVPATATPATGIADDPATSPFPIWDPLGAYPAATKIVWHRQVFQARYWTSGFAPDTSVTNALDNPWSLVGPVLPGDTPAPLPTLPAGSYPQWTATDVYEAGTRVQVGLVPYEAKWWSQAQEPGVALAGGTPWVLVITG